MLKTYRSVYRVPGSVGFSSAGFLARLPISMLGIVIVLLVASTSGGYALAGAVAATFSLSSAACQPPLSRLADRYGQLRAVAPQVVVATVGSVTLVWLASADAPTWTLFASAAVAGGAYPNVGALVRARWSAQIGGTPELRTAYSMESVLDELIFVLGPPVITLLAVHIGSGPAMLVAAGLLAIGAVLFLGQRATEPVPSGLPPAGGPSAISMPGLRTITMLLVMLGGVFGAVEVTTVAFAAQRHQPSATAIVLSTYALSSMLAGLYFGSRKHSRPLHQLLVRFSVLVPLTILGFPFAQTTFVLAGLTALAGLLVAPTLITCFQLVEAITPSGQLTEGLTWATTGITAGASIAAAGAGLAIDAFGTPHAFWVAAGFSVATAAVGLIGVRWLRPSDAGQRLGSGLSAPPA